MNINQIGAEAHAINLANGWEVFTPESWPVSSDHPEERRDKVRFLCTHTALFHTEAAEATEAVRKDDLDNFAEELADIVIRVASVAFGIGIDLHGEIQCKLDYTRHRGLHHGGKEV